MNFKRLSKEELDEKLYILNNISKAKWTVNNSKLTKEFHFRNFIKAFTFMNKCGDYIDKNNHHPEWFNVYNKVLVTLTTHDVGGISYKDFNLAMHMEILNNESTGHS